MRKLSPHITSFEAFHKALLAFVSTGKPCFSVRVQKRYITHMEGEIIIMQGQDRKQPSRYSPEQLSQVYQLIKNSNGITTTMLAPAVGRHRSPLLALMLGAGVILKH